MNRNEQLAAARENLRLQRELKFALADCATESNESDSDSITAIETEEDEMDFINQKFETRFVDYAKHVPNSSDAIPVRGQPAKSYGEQQYKHKIRLDTWNYIVEKAKSEDDAEKLIFDMLRVYRPKAYEKIHEFTHLVNNIESVFTVYNEAIRGTKKGALIATELTDGMTTNEAAKRTKYSKQMIRLVKRTKNELKEKEKTKEKEKSKETEEMEVEAHTKCGSNCGHGAHCENRKNSDRNSGGRKWCGYCGGGNRGCEYCVDTFQSDSKATEPANRRWFTEWSWKVAPRGHSNDPKRRFMWTTWKESYSEYKKAATGDKTKVMGYTWFKERCDEAKIRKAKFDKYRCEICFQGLTAISKKLKGETSNELETKIATYRQHTALFETQSALFRSQKETLGNATTLIVMDYSTIHETAKFKLKDLNFTVYYKENERLVHRFYDFWSKEKKDYKYTSQAFTDLLSHQFFDRFSEVIIWSDGGLKTKEILYYFSEIAATIRKPIEVNYFAPYHGHSVCDAHFGAGKRSLRQTVGVGLVESESQVIEVFSKLKNTIKGMRFLFFKKIAYRLIN